jgi:signal transduction histidine kinase
LSFSLTVITLLGITLLFIFTLFAEYREEEFQQRQKEKITTTLSLLTQTRQLESSLIEALDRLTIDDLYNEKLLIFDRYKRLIYTSIDDTPIRYSGEIIEKLTRDNPWIERKDGLYDVVGIVIENENTMFYGISKAYDFYGYSKLNYLKNVLIAAFIVIAIIVLVVSAYLSEKITFPIIDMARRIKDYDFIKKYEPVPVASTHLEMGILADQFNKLMKRMEEVFSFQKHAIHHISHELKTPVSILVSNFERMEKENNPDELHRLIANQKQDTRELAAIIDALLEIAKIESGHLLLESTVRIDDLIFDIVDEVSILYPDFQFSVEYTGDIGDETHYTVKGNQRLLKSALLNLIQNAVHYSGENKATIRITPEPGSIQLVFINIGELIRSNEQQFIFQHFFRGSNNLGKRGFGLGLVLVNRILTLHTGTVGYSNDGIDRNEFRVTLPLSHY